MKKFTRRSSAVPRRNYCCKPGVKIKESNILEVQQKQSPKKIYSHIKSPPTTLKFKGKNVANRCCYVTPSNRDFGQYYAGGISPKYSKKEHVKQKRDPAQVSSLIKSQYIYAPGISTSTQLKKLKKKSRDLLTLSHASQTSYNKSKFTVVFNGSSWQKVDGSDNVDKIISDGAPGIECSSEHYFISEVPRVKVIAEKFSKFKRGNLELRKLDEKVVCVEYDVFRRSKNDKVLKLTQKMRAFFSIKSFDNDRSKEQKLPRIPSVIKNKFQVLDEDLGKLTVKEIEFIDGMIEENKSYLDDLKRILKRKQVIKAQKNKTSLDLQSLYEMAKRDRPQLHCDFSGVNLLSNAELLEIKDLILQRCTSSVQGFRRRKIQQKKRDLSQDIGVISESIMAELLTITKSLNVSSR